MLGKRGSCCPVTMGLLFCQEKICHLILEIFVLMSHPACHNLGDDFPNLCADKMLRSTLLRCIHYMFHWLFDHSSSSSENEVKCDQQKSMKKNSCNTTNLSGVFLSARFTGISPFLSCQWRSARHALIGQFTCLLSFQPRSWGVLSFN